MSTAELTKSAARTTEETNKIGFWAVFAIVTGSQIGTGIFSLPTGLAPYGTFGLFGCMIAGVGALFLCIVFAELCKRWPRTGGPHVYVQKVFGKAAAFFCGWTYWVISWVSTTAVVIISIGYLAPAISAVLGQDINTMSCSREIYLVLEIMLLVIIALINLKGIKFAGAIEFLLAILKFIPLVILPVLALYQFNKNNFVIAPEMVNLPNWSLLGKAALFAMWGFIGLETATTPADSVVNPSVTIPKAIVLGTLIVALLYTLNFIGIMGMMDGAKLMYSSAPYVDAAQRIFGGHWYLFISIMAFIICVASLNAWILASGQIALGLAIDGFMPKFFRFKNKGDAPVWGVLLSSAGILPLLFLNTNKALTEQIKIIIDISVIAFLFVYMACILSFLKNLINTKYKAISMYFVAIIALLFCSWIIYETKFNELLIASLFIISGIPVYFLWYRRYSK
jgi:APA family basic amino acid/polyamine antiporter